MTDRESTLRPRLVPVPPVIQAAWDEFLAKPSRVEAFAYLASLKWWQLDGLKFHYGQGQLTAPPRKD